VTSPGKRRALEVEEEEEEVMEEGQLLDDEGEALDEIAGFDTQSAD